MAHENTADFDRLRADAAFMEFLVDAGELLSSSLDYRKTLKTVCSAAAQTIADICILEIGSVNDLELIAAAHRNPELTPELERNARRLERSGERVAHPVLQVLDRAVTVLVPQIDDAWIAAHASSERHAELMRRMRYRSMVVVPVRSQIWGITGALTLVRTDMTDRPYDEEALRFAEDLGRRCGIAVGKARLHSQTLDIAERFQKAALPHSLPEIPGYQLDAYYEPADAALLVGGDWYDAFLLRNGDIGISIGDISGHGIESAALMSSIRNAIRMAMVIEPDLSEVLRNADFVFRNETEPGMFATAAVAVIDRATAQMRATSAGHPAPLVWTRGIVRDAITAPGVPLGCGDLGDVHSRVTTTQLEPTSMAVFYTDGIIEATKAPIAGEQAIRNALLDPAIRNTRYPARALRNSVPTRAHSDDIGVLTVRYEGDD
ncbi:MAG TPA: GAF domain-containing SpoIIE family protein phosphatase [Candidatus Elarobacter sp.]